MSESDETKNLRLIYVLKVGQNTKKENIFEFIFSNDETNINYREWGWDLSPACDNATPPTEEYIDKISTIKTNEFDLFCLHDAVDREYMHGYYTIHALAYEIEHTDNDDAFFGLGSDLYGDDEDVPPLLVFLYGMSYNVVKDLLYSRNIRI